MNPGQAESPRCGSFRNQSQREVENSRKPRLLGNVCYLLSEEAVKDWVAGVRAIPITQPVRTAAREIGKNAPNEAIRIRRAISFDLNGTRRLANDPLASTRTRNVLHATLQPRDRVF